MSTAALVTHAASAALRYAQRMGVQLKIAAPGAVAWTTVWGFIIDNAQDLGPGDQDTITVNIPVQTGVPPVGGFTTGYALQYNSQTYKVEASTPDNGNYQSAATFTLTGTRITSGDCDIGEVPA